MLIAKKPKGGVKIYYNYKGINKILLKNQYLLLLIKKILDAVYSAKFFIKLNIIIAFNRIKIILSYE